MVVLPTPRLEGPVQPHQCPRVNKRHTVDESAMPLVRDQDLDACCVQLLYRLPDASNAAGHCFEEVVLRPIVDPYVSVGRP